MTLQAWSNRKVVHVHSVHCPEGIYTQQWRKWLQPADCIHWFAAALFSPSIYCLKMSSEFIICLFIGKPLFFLLAAGRHEFNWCLAPQCLWHFFFQFIFYFLSRGHVAHGDCLAVLIRREAIACSGEWCFNTHPLLLRVHWRENWQRWGVIGFKRRQWQKCSVLLLSGESLNAPHAHCRWRSRYSSAKDGV